MLASLVMGRENLLVSRIIPKVCSLSPLGEGWGEGLDKFRPQRLGAVRRGLTGGEADSVFCISKKTNPPLTPPELRGENL